MIAGGGMLQIREAYLVQIARLGLKLKGICGAVELWFYSLLRMKFLRKTPFFLDLKGMVLLDPHTNEEGHLSYMMKSITCRTNDVLIPQNKAFASENFVRNFEGRSAAR